MKDFRPAKKHVEVSVGESVRILRELQGFSQNQLAELSGVPRANLFPPSKTVVFALVSNARRCLRVRSGVIPRYWFSPAGKYRLNRRPNPAVNTDAHRRGFAPAGIAGHLTR